MADVDRPPQIADGREDRRLLTYLAVAMVATGQPVHEIEEDLTVAGPLRLDQAAEVRLIRQQLLTASSIGNGPSPD